MRFWNAAITAVLVMGPSASAFYSTSTSRQRPQASQLFSEPPQALTDYLAKAHEDKLKAIQQIEEKKNAEIESLKQELKALKSAPGALTTTTSAPIPAGLDINSMTKEQLAQKLFAYQQFMAKYIVDAQVQKTKAVLAAENALKQKYEEKFLLLSASTSEITPPPPPSTTTTSVAFQERSAKVSAAAAAGKSRWGDLENEKASQVTGGVGVTNAAPVNGAASPATLALPTPPVAPSTASIRSFDQRNAMVAAAGQAGKSRWGDEEVARATHAAAAARVALPASSSKAPAKTVPATSVPVSSIPVPPEVEAADHGLRADGGVGGPSLAERINLGAQLLQASTPAPLGNTRAPSTVASSTYYTKRNAMVVAAAKAGKSRWGEMEIQRAQRLAGALPASSSPVKVTPEIAAADHGLRADGGVGGPSLAQRVNFGAALLGQ